MKAKSDMYEAVPTKSSLANMINEAVQDTRRTRSADDDIPRNERKKIPNAAETALHFGGRDSDSEFADDAAAQGRSLPEDVGNSNSDDEEDEFYKQVVELKKRKGAIKEEEAKIKKQRLEEMAALEEGDDGQQAEAGKRTIGYQIEKNKGLDRQKKTDISRVKLKKKFSKASKNRRGQVREVRRETKPYAGESTAINTRVVHSRSLRQ